MAKGKSRRPAREGGFSITELLVVLALLGIVMMFGGPNFLHWHRQYKLTNMARDVASMAKLARHKAVAHNNPMALTVDKDRRLIEVARITDLATRTLEVEETIPIDKNVDFNSASVDFMPDGMANASAWTTPCLVIELDYHKADKTFVNIFVSGVVRTTRKAAHPKCS